MGPSPERMCICLRMKRIEDENEDDGGKETRRAVWPASQLLVYESLVNQGLEFPGVLLGRQNFAEAEVEAIGTGGCIADRDVGAAPGGGAILHLDPVGISGWGEVLMDESLSGGHGAGDGAVVIVADGKDPGVITRGDQAGGRCAGRSVGRAEGAEGARTVGASGVNTLEAHDGDGGGNTLGKSGGDIDVA